MDNKQSIEDNVEKSLASSNAYRQREDAKDERRAQRDKEALDRLMEDLESFSDSDLPINANLPLINQDSEIKTTNVTPNSVTVEEIITPVSKYEYPAPKLDLYKGWEAEDILDNLYSFSQTAKKADQYVLVRQRFCDLSIELNYRGLIAPAFRPSPTIPFLAKNRNYSHLLIQQDRIVIDCHWLHTRKVEINSSEPNWRGLFNLRKDFSFDKVSEFACHDIKNEYRATAIMKLTQHQQNQMRALWSKETQRRFMQLYASPRDGEGKRTQQPRLELIELAINQWCEADVRMAQWRSQYAALAMAIELTGDSSPTQLGELMGLMLGVPPLAENTVRQKMIKLRKAIDKYAVR